MSIAMVFSFFPSGFSNIFLNINKPLTRRQMLDAKNDSSYIISMNKLPLKTMMLGRKYRAIKAPRKTAVIMPVPLKSPIYCSNSP